MAALPNHSSNHCCGRSVNLQKLQDEYLNDVVIVCEGHEFRAHKIVLSTVSPYFRGAFSNWQWQDTNCDRLELRDVSATAMDTILHFIYMGEIKVTDDNEESLEELLAASDYLQIEELVECSFESLAQHQLTVKRFLDLYNKAMQLNNELCISLVTSFLSANFLTIAKSKDFCLLEVNQLKQILQLLEVHEHGLDLIVDCLLKWAEFRDKRETHVHDFLVVLAKNGWCADCLSQIISIYTSEKVTGDITIAPSAAMAHKRQDSNVSGIVFGSNVKKQKLVLLAEDYAMMFYDIETEEWKTGKVMCADKNRFGNTIAVHGNHVYFIGGGNAWNDSGTECDLNATSDNDEAEHWGRHDDNVPSKEDRRVILFCPLANISQKANGNLVFPVLRAGAVILDDFLYVVNGVHKYYNEPKVVQRFNLNDGSCELVNSTNFRHAIPEVLIFGKDLIVFDSFMPHGLELYSPLANQWTAVTEIPGYIFGLAAAIVETQLLVIGEDYLEKESALVMHRYDFTTGSWTQQDISGRNEKAEWVRTGWKKNRPTLFVCYEKELYLYDINSSHWHVLLPEASTIRFPRCGISIIELAKKSKSSALRMCEFVIG